jgi:hypothetical protein
MHFRKDEASGGQTVPIAMCVLYCTVRRTLFQQLEATAATTGSQDHKTHPFRNKCVMRNSNSCECHCDQGERNTPTILMGNTSHWLAAQRRSRWAVPYEPINLIIYAELPCCQRFSSGWASITATVSSRCPNTIKIGAHNMIQ